MGIRKFTKEKALSFSWEGIKAWSYSSSENLTTGSAIIFEVNGNHGKVKSKVSDRIYYVIKGHGRFIGDDCEINVRQGDVIIVNKNTPYDYEGKMKLFLIHIPSYDDSQEVILEKKKGRA